MKTTIRAYRDDKATQLQQGVTRKGLPRCINCMKVIPRSVRQYRREGVPVLFCKNACAMNWGHYAARQIFIGAQWTEPAPPPRKNISFATSVGVGTKIRRKGHRYEILDREVNTAPNGDGYTTDFTVTLHLRDLDSGKEKHEVVSDRARVEILAEAH